MTSLFAQGNNDAGMEMDLADRVNNGSYKIQNYSRYIVEHGT
jgi:hypothetical protein